MIDAPTLARSMVTQGRKYLVDRPGVYDVHFCDDEVREIGPSPLWRFIDDWELADDLRDRPVMESQQFIGIVGEGCAVLYPIETILAALEEA